MNTPFLQSCPHCGACHDSGLVLTDAGRALLDALAAHWHARRSAPSKAMTTDVQAAAPAPPDDDDPV